MVLRTLYSYTTPVHMDKTRRYIGLSTILGRLRMQYLNRLSRLEYTTHDPLLDYTEGGRMTTEEILTEAKMHAENLGIELDIPAVLGDVDLDDIEWTLSLYGEEEYAEEFVNRFIHAEVTEDRYSIMEAA
jgi:hypothetical protein